MIAIRIICKTINPTARAQTGIFKRSIDPPLEDIYACGTGADEEPYPILGSTIFAATGTGRIINRVCARRHGVNRKNLFEPRIGSRDSEVEKSPSCRTLLDQ